MAKSKTEVQEDNTPLEPIKPRKKKKKKKKGLWIFLGIVLVTGILLFFSRKIVTKQLAKVTQGIPVLNKIFKQADNPYEGVSKEQLIEEITGLKEEKKALEANIESIKQEKELLNQKITSLSQYEQNYMSFLEQKQKWDEEIALKDPKLFMEQYEAMYPDDAKQIYSELKTTEALTKTQKEFATSVGQMEEEAAARALEKLVPTDQELVKIIFEGMELERRALILSAMDSQIAAQVIKLLSPEIQTIAQ